MQSRVEREGLLKVQAVETGGLERIEDQVPAMRGDRARDRHEAVVSKKLVAKRLLACARNSWPQPIGVRNGVAFHDVDLCNIGNPRSGDHVGDSIEDLETLVNGDLQDSGRRIERAVDGANAFAGSRFCDR